MDNDKMTPGRYAYERVEKISPHLSGWGYADKPAWEQFAIDIHEAVERQRRELNDKTLSESEKDGSGMAGVICECCFAVVPRLDVIKGFCRACRGCGQPTE